MGQAIQRRDKVIDPFVTDSLAGQETADAGNVDILENLGEILHKTASQIHFQTRHAKKASTVTRLDSVLNETPEVDYAFFTNSDFNCMAPMPSILQSIS